MQPRGQAVRVRAYFDEDDTWQGQPLQAALLDHLFRAGCLGATVFRGVAGFGATGEMLTASIEVLSAKLPLILEWVDQPQRVEQVLPSLVEIVGERLVTVEPVEVARYPRHEPHPISGARKVAEVMTHDPVAVSSETPLHELVRLLVGRDYRALPVVDADRRVVGIVTNGDLVARGGAPLRMELFGALSPEALAREIQTLETVGRTTADIMTRDVVTVRPETDLASAAHRMVVRRLKRLPVVDQSGRLVGMVSRFDLLRSSADGYARATAHEVHGGAPVGARVADVMSRDVPTVGADAHLLDVFDAVISSPLNSAVVTDDAGRPIGVVTDAELLRRLSPADQPSVARVLMSKLPFAHLALDAQAALRQATGERARELMVAPSPTVAGDEPVGLAARHILAAHRQIMPVVDADDRLVGLVDRDALLRAAFLR